MRLDEVLVETVDKIIVATITSMNEEKYNIIFTTNTEIELPREITISYLPKSETIQYPPILESNRGLFYQKHECLISYCF